MPWLLEVLGPQHAGKTTISDMMALTLEANGIPALRAETDHYVYNLFPIYAELKATGKRDEAHELLSKRWTLIHDLTSEIIRRGLNSGFTIIHDHINTRVYKRDLVKKIAAEANAKYLSILVTAPLDTLKERWRQSEISEVSIAELERTFKDFQTLREEYPFTMTIDTSITTPEEAVEQILSTVYPNIQSRKESSDKVEDADAQLEPAEFLDDFPLICPGSFQILKERDAFILVHNHHRYITDSTGLLILSLCNGKYSLREIAKIAGTGLDTTKSTLDVLKESQILSAPPNLKRPVKPPHPTILRA